MKTIGEVKLYSTQEVAQMLGVSVSCVQRKIRNTEITATRIGRSFYVSDENLKEFLSGKTQERPAPVTKQ